MDEIPNQIKYYAVLMTPRVGSGWLCSMLRNSKVLGNPKEYYWVPPKNRTNNYNLSTVEDKKYTEKLIKTWSTPNGVFGVKGDLRVINIMQQHIADDIQIIYLARKDVIMQAISWHLRVVNDDWTLSFNEKKTCSETPYDNYELLTTYRKLSNLIEKTNKYMLNCSNTPLLIYYEDLCDNPQGEVDKVANFLNVDIENYNVRFGNKILRTNASYEWKVRFIAENRSKIDPEHLKYEYVTI